MEIMHVDPAMLNVWVSKLVGRPVIVVGVVFNATDNAVKLAYIEDEGGGVG